jgi:hypothetical protein
MYNIDCVTFDERFRVYYRSVKQYRGGGGGLCVAPTLVIVGKPLISNCVYQGAVGDSGKPFYVMAPSRDADPFYEWLE